MSSAERTAGSSCSSSSGSSSLTSPGNVYHEGAAVAAAVLQELLGLRVPERDFLGRRGALLAQLGEAEAREAVAVWLSTLGDGPTMRFMGKGGG